MFGRGKPAPSHKEQLLDELAQSYGHLKLAAGHVAGGAAEKATPGYDKARNVATRGWGTTKDAFSPLYEQMRQGAANARREYVVVEKKNRWPMLVGLLAAGAAVGAAGAMVARRRRNATWDEYEPMPDEDEFGFGTSESDERASATAKVSKGAASVADKLSAQAGKVADSMHDKAEAAEKSSEQ
jgi:hypothetical protein